MDVDEEAARQTFFPRRPSLASSSSSAPSFSTASTSAPTSAPARPPPFRRPSLPALSPGSGSASASSRGASPQHPSTTTPTTHHLGSQHQGQHHHLHPTNHPSLHHTPPPPTSLHPTPSSSSDDQHQHHLFPYANPHNPNPFAPLPPLEPSEEHRQSSFPPHPNSRRGSTDPLLHASLASAAAAAAAAATPATTPTTTVPTAATPTANSTGSASSRMGSPPNDFGPSSRRPSIHPFTDMRPASASASTSASGNGSAAGDAVKEENAQRQQHQHQQQQHQQQQQQHDHTLPPLQNTLKRKTSATDDPMDGGFSTAGAGAGADAPPRSPVAHPSSHSQPPPPGYAHEDAGNNGFASSSSSFTYPTADSTMPPAKRRGSAYDLSLSSPSAHAHLAAKFGSNAVANFVDQRRDSTESITRVLGTTGLDALGRKPGAHADPNLFGDANPFPGFSRPSTSSGSGDPSHPHGHDPRYAGMDGTDEGDNKLPEGSRAVGGAPPSGFPSLLASSGDPSTSANSGAAGEPGPSGRSPFGTPSSSTAVPPEGLLTPSQQQLKETPYSRSPELRVSHKLAERKRRKEMKDLFDELRDHLPVERGPKTSKWEILSKAIDHVAQLQQDNAAMARELDLLHQEVNAYRSGNPPPPRAQGPPVPPPHQQQPPSAPPVAPPLGGPHQPPPPQGSPSSAAHPHLGYASAFNVALPPGVSLPMGYPAMPATATMPGAQPAATSQQGPPPPPPPQQQQQQQPPLPSSSSSQPGMSPQDLQARQAQQGNQGR